MAQNYVPDHYPIEFATNWEHLLQQKPSRLMPHTVKHTVRGKEKVMNQLASRSMRRITARSQATSESQQDSAKRWLRHYPYEDVANFDEFDATFLGDIVLPTSETVQSMAMAYNRTADSVIIDALGGTAYTGDNGTDATVLPSGQKVAVNYVPSGTPANSGLTLGKLIKAKSILGKAEALDDGEMPILVVSQQQLDDMLNNVNQVTSKDYNNIQTLVRGEIDTFMGFKWVRTELLTLTSSVRYCYAYVPSGVAFTSEGRKVHMDILPTRSHSLQIRSVATFGATRNQEKKVVEIACSEA